MSNKKNKPAGPSPEQLRAISPEKNLVDLSKREFQTDRKGSMKPPTIGLQDIDESIHYYFTEVIKPTVRQQGSIMAVPVMYGSPERWSNVQKDGALRDRTGKLQAPLIMFKRNSLAKNRSLSNKMDANSPSQFFAVENKYTKNNVYDQFSRLTNRTPKKEYYAAVVPDFVTITYDCVVFTNYVEQMNNIVEAINYAEDSYWGDKSKFMFRARINNFGTSIDVSVGQDRIVRTEFTVELNGYMIPATKQADMNNFRKYFSKAQVMFKFETAGSLEELQARAATQEDTPGTRFFDGGSTQGASGGMSVDEITYLSLATTALADAITSNTATFNNCTLAPPPTGFDAPTVKDFKVYVNGQYVPTPQVTSIVETVDGLVVTIDTDALQYTLLPQFEIVLVGKFNKNLA